MQAFSETRKPTPKCNPNNPGLELGWVEFSCVIPSKSELQMEELLERAGPRGKPWPMKLKLINYPMMYNKVKFTS